MSTLESTTPSVEPLVFQGRLTLEDVFAFRRCLGYLRVRKSLRWAAWLVGTGLALLSAGSIALQEAHPVTIGVIAAWCYCVLLRLEWRWKIQRHYRWHPEDYLESRVTLSESSVGIDNEAQHSEFQWRMVGLVGDAQEGLLFCDRIGQPLFWLPQRLFAENDLRRRVLELAARNKVLIRKTS